MFYLVSLCGVQIELNFIACGVVITTANGVLRTSFTRQKHFVGISIPADLPSETDLGVLVLNAIN